ncbi:TonB-dependent receptor plug domain-containing protein [Desulfoluna spongiiphila]|uniref:TonB-dependent receptor plug domain-containing protein n=1 Tax=Desulfoluna spongiiphila TaxID=419481 RepID=UPI00125AD0B9|nr:TonB-dependent receptor [Desulfoluna spongiiphila]VVS91347.1 tonb-dependent receptor-like beta-barrel [Desulfoluna spongiiphila]
MLKRHVKHLACTGVAAIVLCSAGVVSAGTAAGESLNEVVVTAERFPTGEKETPRFVTMYSSEELMETGADNLAQALRRKGGFSYKSFGPQGVSFGGMNSEITARGVSKGTLILVNGCPVQGAAGQGYDLDMIPLEQIARVEVMKGAASTLYGADAMACVVNIITKKNAKSTRASVAVEAGSHGHRTASAEVSSPRVNVGVSYAHLDAVDKISQATYPKSPSKGYSYARDAVDSGGLNLNATLADGLYFDYLGSISTTGYTKNMDTGVVDKETDQEHVKHFADLRFEKEHVKLKAFGYLDQLDREELTSKGLTDESNKNYNYGVQGDYRASLGDVELTTGADYVYRGADYDEKYGRHHRDDVSVFVQAKRDFFESLTVVLGFREQLIYGDCDNKDYDIFLPSAGVTYRVSPGLNFFANAGKAFKAPTFNDLYYKGDALTGNPDLDPESGWTYEGGVKYDNDYMRVRLAGFHMTYEDKIETMTVGKDTTKFNAGDYESTGVEWETSFYPFVNQASFLDAVSLDVAGYLADTTAEDTDSEEYQAAPEFQTSVGASYITEPLVLNLNVDILRERERDLPSYNPVNFAGKLACWKGYLTFGVDNMFDETVVTWGDNTPGKTKHYEYYDLGRTYKLGYEMRF